MHNRYEIQSTSYKTILPYFLSNVSITIAPISVELDGGTARGVLWQASPGRFLLDIPDVARYLIEDGRKIIIEPAPGMNFATISYYFKMLPLAALLYQRGILAFHASVISNNRGAIVLAGDSGVGKSSLMVSLLNRGWMMLSDDIGVIEQDEHGQFFIHPICHEIFLWPDSIKKMGIELNKLPQQVASRLSYSKQGQYETIKQPINTIYWLSVTTKNNVLFDDVDISSRFQAAGSLLYNSHIADVLFDKVSYLQIVASLAKSVPFKLIKRPRDKWSVDELTDMITLDYLG